jgi:threonine dehydratase
VIGLADLEAAAEIVHRVVAPTPQIRWPLLCERTAADVWVKHENHTAAGAFKLRGGVLYMHELLRREPHTKGVIAATTGNHGQSVALAAANALLRAVLVAPHGNSPEKNAAMRAFGAELIEHGRDFQAALEHAEELAEQQQLHFVHSFNMTLVRGVASYALELFRGAPDLDAVYVPVGLGSGICGMIAARDALGLKTEIIGVVASRAPTYALSFTAGHVVATDSALTMAGGMACRIANPEALEIILKGAARIVTVEEDEIHSGMRDFFTDTHNTAEGAGAAPLAALLKERERMKGRRVALILSGGNIDRAVFAKVLSAGDSGVE